MRQPFREFSIVGVGAVLSRIAALVTLLVLTRHLGPPEFGVFSVGWVIYLLASQLVSGIDLGYVDLEARDPKVSLQNAYFRTKFVAAAAVAIAATILPLVWGAFAHWNGTFTAALIVAGLAGAAWTVLQSNLSSYRAHREFGRFAFWTVVFNLCVAILVGVLVAFGTRSPTAYLGCYLLTGTAAAAFLSFTDRNDPNKGTRDEQRRIIRHSRWLIISSVLFSVGDRIEVLIAAKFLTPFDLGIYSAPARLFGLFSFFLSSMGTVLLPRASRLRDHHAIRTYVRRALLFTGMVAVIAAIVAVASHPLTNLLLGERYISAAEIVPAFCISAVLLSAQATLMWLLFTVGRPGAFALLNALVLASKLTAAFVLIPLAGANGAAWSLAISYGMGAIFIALFVAVTPRGAWESSTTDSGDGMQVTGEMSV